MRRRAHCRHAARARLGAIVPTIDNAIFAPGIAALQTYLSSVGYMLFLTTSGYDPDTELGSRRAAW